MRICRKLTPSTLKEALIRLGYCYMGVKGPNVEWRRRQYHLTFRQKKHEIVLRIHEDIPYALPPFHKARHRGKNLEAEIDKIMETYRRIRSA